MPAAEPLTWAGVPRDQLVTAANNTLYTAVYADHGFIITKQGSRPKIRRYPKPITDAAETRTSSGCAS